MSFRDVFFCYIAELHLQILTHLLRIFEQP